MRRLRTHFYSKGFDKIVTKFVNKCKFGQLFTQKTKKHAIEPNRVPERCWDETSVDLFGPLPCKNNVLVIKDLASRYPLVFWAFLEYLLWFWNFESVLKFKKFKNFITNW